MQTKAAASPFEIDVNGRLIPAATGQTVAAALIGAGITVFRHTPTGAPRGIFCGMGVCYDCLVTIDGLADQRACITPVRPGMHVQIGDPGAAQAGQGSSGADRGAEIDGRR